METVEVINKRLADIYGKFESGDANWRVVWSDDIFEKRWTFHTDEGFELVNPRLVERPKYLQWAAHVFILERIMPVPDFVESDLTTTVSYEPVWVFRDKNGNALPPVWDAIEFLIQNVMKQSAKVVGRKYKDPEEGIDPIELKKERVRLLQEHLYGNETPIGDALSYDSGVGYGVRKRNEVN